MRVAVIGGGTAGFLASVHLTKEFPMFDLYHIYDPNLPTIGVGEGTTPDFQDWLALTTNVSLPDLQATCKVTQKFGIQFENWGNLHQKFMHNFYPIDEQYAYHISAKRLVDLLKDHVSATHVGKKVVQLDNSWEMARLTFADGSRLEVDFVFDARGFPREINDADHVRLSFVPTNAALIRSAPPVSYNRVTRSVARPYGWIFIIPLTHRTSYGYVYNKDINSVGDIEQDFDLFLREEGVLWDTATGEKHLTFPSFVQRRFFEGSVFTIGNTASFVEPLEATSISFILTQIKVACRWPLQAWAAANGKGPHNQQNIEVTNRYLRDYLRRMAFFIGWHYHEGSRFDTPFWAFARANFRQQASKPENQDLVQTFAQFVQAAHHFPNPMEDPGQFAVKINETFANIARIEKQTQSTTVKKSPKFGLFSELSFAEVGHGLGYSLSSALAEIEIVTS